MISRTAGLLVFAVGAWTVGGVMAVNEHWHPFAVRSRHSVTEVRVFAPGRGMHRIADPRLVRLTPNERAMLPPGYPVEVAEHALSRALAAELNERTAAHAVRDPSSQAVMLSEQLISVRPRAIPEFDPMVLWPGVASRLEASGALPPHVHAPGRAVVHVRPATRRGR